MVHGVVNNAIFDPMRAHNGAWHWFATRRVKTLWQAAKESGYVSASVAFPTSVGARGDFIAPEFWWDGSELDSDFIDAVSTPQGLIQEMEHDIGRFAGGLDLTDDGDHQRFAATKWLLEKKLAVRSTGTPFFLSSYFASFDESAHAHGVYSSEAAVSLMKIDQMVGDLAETARVAAGGNLIVCVVSDHGSINNTHNINPNVRLAEAGLIESDASGRVTDWKAWSQRAGGTSEIRIRDSSDKTAVEALDRVMAELGRDPDSGILEVLTASEARLRGGFPDAAYVLVARKGYEIRDNFSGPYCTTVTTQKAQHGYSEFFPEMRASFLMTGPGVPCTDVGKMHLIDIAPTLAARMGIKLPDAQGRDVIGAIAIDIQ